MRSVGVCPWGPLSVLGAALLAAPPAAALPSPPASSSSTTAPIFSGLGGHARAIAHATPEAQRLFNQGLAFLSAFNHDEALRAFRAAAAQAPRSVMPRWGIAAACGPHVNNPVVTPECHAEARAALAAALPHLAGVPLVEQALVQAARARFGPPALKLPPQDRSALDMAYADAMRAVWTRHPKDADVGALTAEALMDLRPWDLWDENGQARPGTDEIVALLERVLAMSPHHPLALHLYIHAVEASAHPERAAGAADKLRALAPGLGHLVHMASHIDVRTGRWREAVETNQRAMAADDAYEKLVPQQGFYRIYMGHNRHMLVYAAMMRGQSALALREAHALVERIPTSWRREHRAAVDAMMAIPFEVMMRFGRWRELLDADEPPLEFPVARAMHHAAQGVALAAQGKPKEARRAQDAFLDARADVAQDTPFGTNRALDVLVVMSRLLEGEILIAEGKLGLAISTLQDAVLAEDQLRYDEPPDWVQPTRHALGAALLRVRKTADAETVFREDLKRHPENGWSLWGLGRALRLQGKVDGPDGAVEVEARFKAAWADADIKLSSSCLCLPGV